MTTQQQARRKTINGDNSGSVALERVAPESQLAQADPETLGALLARSGVFADARDAAKCAVKILAGRELGIPPLASMVDVHFIEGKPSMGGNLLAALIKRSGKYDYRVRKDADGHYLHDNTRCELVAFENDREIGESVFTIADAEVAGLVGKDNWKHYPRNMLFNRAISNLIAWHMPDLTIDGGRIYTPEELGVEVDEHGDAIVVDGELVRDPEHEAPEPGGPEPEAAEPEPSQARLTGSQRSKVHAMAKAAGVDETPEKEALLYYFGGDARPEHIERRYSEAVYEALGDPKGALAYIRERAASGEDRRAQDTVDRYLTTDTGEADGPDVHPDQQELG